MGRRESRQGDKGSEEEGASLEQSLRWGYGDKWGRMRKNHHLVLKATALCNSTVSEYKRVKLQAVKSRM